MCGICGIYYRDPTRHVEGLEISRMAESIGHRGRDDEGFLLDGNLSLGHKRLSIIDLSQKGRQPICNEEGSILLVCNGEIYNHKELREEFRRKGHRFRSESDSEVILHGYEEDGASFVSRLNGMFAFAVWDRRSRRLFAARDRLGIKPFYYARPNGSFIFASEIKALLDTGLVKPEPDPYGLADYLTFQFCLGEKTLFKNIYRLPPGHIIWLDGHWRARVEKYWEPEFASENGHGESCFKEELQALLEDAVRLRLQADVEVGAHLSGGLDSSSVACLAASQLGGALKTFSCAFREPPGYDETRYARIVSRHAGSDHYEVFPTADQFVEAIPRLLYYMDEPAGGPALFAHYALSHLASSHVKVVLTGHGADEVFGGYIRYLIAYLERCLKEGIEGTGPNDGNAVTLGSIIPNLRQLDGYQPLMRHFWMDGLFEPDDRRYFRLIDRSGPLLRMINRDFLPPRSEYDPYEAYREIFRSAPCRSLINRMTWFDMKTLLPALLHVEDRMSMAFCLESRVPLLDHRIVELAARIPPAIKYRGGRCKHIFREVVSRWLPAEVVHRQDKMGFPVPVREWARSGPVREFVLDTFSGARSRQRGLLRDGLIEGLLESEQGAGRALWGLLCLELWMQIFLDGAR